jgi:hypothetical protein
LLKWLELQTKADRLTLHPDSTDTIGLGAVFSRFDNPEYAIQLAPKSFQREVECYMTSMAGPWQRRRKILGFG